MFNYIKKSANAKPEKKEADTFDELTKINTPQKPSPMITDILDLPDINDIVNEKVIVKPKYSVEMVHQKYPELTPNQARVLFFLRTFETHFPISIWTLNNYLEIDEKELGIICELLCKDAKYKIRKRIHMEKEAYERIV